MPRSPTSDQTIVQVKLAALKGESSQSLSTFFDIPVYTIKRLLGQAPLDPRRSAESKLRDTLKHEKLNADAKKLFELEGMRKVIDTDLEQVQKKLKKNVEENEKIDGKGKQKEKEKEKGEKLEKLVKDKAEKTEEKQRKKEAKLEAERVEKEEKKRKREEEKLLKSSRQKKDGSISQSSNKIKDKYEKLQLHSTQLISSQSGSKSHEIASEASGSGTRNGNPIKEPAHSREIIFPPSFSTSFGSTCSPQVAIPPNYSIPFGSAVSGTFFPFSQSVNTYQERMQKLPSLENPSTVTSSPTLMRVLPPNLRPFSSAIPDLPSNMASPIIPKITISAVVIPQAPIPAVAIPTVAQAVAIPEVVQAEVKEIIPAKVTEAIPREITPPPATSISFSTTFPSLLPFASLLPHFESEGVTSSKDLLDLAKLNRESIDLFLRNVLKESPKEERLSGLQRIVLGEIIKGLAEVEEDKDENDMAK